MIPYTLMKKPNGAYSVKYKHGGEFFSGTTSLSRTQATFLRDELNTAAKANRLANGYKASI
jgi:hypothetical protein